MFSRLGWGLGGVTWGGGGRPSWSVCDLSFCVLISFEELTLSMIRTMAHLISTPSKFRFDATCIALVSNVCFIARMTLSPFRNNKAIDEAHM